MGMSLEQAQASGAAVLNRAAASDQAEELRVADGPGSGPPPAEKDGPGAVVTFTVAGRLDIPSRRDPQLLEVARAELPAEYYAKAVPVLTPRVYRLAKLTNKGDLVLLPGEATVYVGGDFVGRMRLPLVAAGEPFVAGFGVDPQLQVGRRLLRKSRTVQGGNQIFTYEFRISLRNYRPGPVQVQLWDRLPKPQGEAVAVNLVKTSAELSTDAMYQRTARMDNLLRWDLEVPPGTVGDRPMDLNYEFRLEYARDLPRPRFDSGGLGEAPTTGAWTTCCAGTSRCPGHRRRQADGPGLEFRLEYARDLPQPRLESGGLAEDHRHGRHGRRYGRHGRWVSNGETPGGLTCVAITLARSVTGSPACRRRSGWPSDAPPRSPSPAGAAAPGSGGRRPPSAAPPRRRARRRTPSPSPARPPPRSSGPPARLWAWIASRAAQVAA